MNSPAIALLLSMMVGASALVASPALAEDTRLVQEVRGGILLQSCCGIGTNKEDGVGLNAEALFRSPKFLSVLGAPRPVVGTTIATDGDATSQFYAGFDWTFDFAEKFFFSAMLGGAIHTGETDEFDPIADNNRVDTTLFFGCRAHFRMAGDLGYRISERVSASVHWSHISNAGLCTHNEGLDHLGLRIGYRF